MKKTKYTGWINIFRNIGDGSFFVGEEIFESEAEAAEVGDEYLDEDTDPCATIKITWNDDFKNSVITTSKSKERN